MSGKDTPQKVLAEHPDNQTSLPGVSAAPAGLVGAVEVSVLIKHTWKPFSLRASGVPATVPVEHIQHT